MKSIPIFLLLSFLFLFNACSSVDIASFPPEVQIEGVLLNGVEELKYSSSTDSIGNLNILLDTISQADTLFLSLKLQAFFHNIVDFQLLSDTSDFMDLYDNTHLSKVINLGTSDVPVRKFKYKEGFKSDDFLVAFITKKDSTNAPITLILNSDVVFDVPDLNNTDTVRIYVITR